MVAPKNIASTNKNVEKPTASKIVEPDGMMTIDLNSNEYILEEHKQLVRKNTKWEQLKYMSKLLCLLGSICMAIAFFLILAFLNKEYHLISSTMEIKQTSNSSLTSEQYLTQYINNLTKLMFKKKVMDKLSMEDYSEEISLCRLTKTLDDCCKFFRESNLQDLIDICTVDDILKTFIDFEMDTPRKKRQAQPYNVEPNADYTNEYFEQRKHEFFDNFQYIDNFEQQIVNPDYQEQNEQYLHNANIPIIQTDSTFKEFGDKQLNPNLESMKNYNNIYKPYDQQNSEHIILNTQSHSIPSTLNSPDYLQNINVPNYQTDSKKQKLEFMGNQNNAFKPYDEQSHSVPSAPNLPRIIESHVVPYLGQPTIFQQESSHHQTPNIYKDEYSYLQNNEQNSINSQYQSKVTLAPDVTTKNTQTADASSKGSHSYSVPIHNKLENTNYQQQQYGHSEDLLNIQNFQTNEVPNQPSPEINLEPHHNFQPYKQTQKIPADNPIFLKNNNKLQEDSVLQKIKTQEKSAVSAPNIRNFILLPTEVQDLILNHITNRPHSAEVLADSITFSRMDQTLSPQKQVNFNNENHEFRSNIELANSMGNTIGNDNQFNALTTDQNHLQFPAKFVFEESPLKETNNIQLKFEPPNNSDAVTKDVFQLTEKQSNAQSHDEILNFPSSIDTINSKIIRNPKKKFGNMQPQFKSKTNDGSETEDFILATERHSHAQLFIPNFVPISQNKEHFQPQFNSRNSFNKDDNLEALSYKKLPGPNYKQTENLVDNSLDKTRNSEDDKVTVINNLPNSSNTINDLVSAETGKCASEENKEINSNANVNTGILSINKDDLNFSKDTQISNDELNTSRKSTVQNETKILTQKTKLQEYNKESQIINEQGDQVSEVTKIENLRENSQQSENFRPKTKLETFATASEDLQSNQQSIVSPCFYPYMSPYMPPVRVGSPLENNYLKVVPVSHPRVQQPLYIINPPMYYNIPQQSYAAQPQNYLSNYIASVPQQVVPHFQPQPTGSQYSGYNTPIHVSAPGGQFYLCNPIPTPTNNIAGVSGVEIREASNLQTLMEEYGKRNESSSQTNARESHLLCPIGEQACLDNTKCVKNYHVCDGEVHCDDASDEIVCTCKQRIGKIRLCDGYCDCPTCEDELGCFGCKHEEFSCDDWSRFRRATCIPKHQRCDNIKQCEITGKDEQGCSILTDHIDNFSLNTVSNSVGFLHRNYKGKWYPTCLGTEEWANEVCQAESGPSTVSPRSHMTLTTDQYKGEFINILPNNEVSLVPTCIQDRAAFVECPPLYCGLRYLFKNAYRGQEVDTSIEDTLNDLERYTLGDQLQNKSILNVTSANIQEYDLYDTENADPAILEESRIVGGKPSQPAAWPWLISIYKNGLFHCGGVLINELWILTAAHCVDRYWLYHYEIQAGSLRRFSFSPMDQTRVAKLVISHEFYSKSNLRDDIALVKVSAPFRYNRYVRPICLPSESTAGANFLKGPFAGTKCTTVGWGATVEHGADPDHVREVEVPILSHCKHKDDNDGDEICAGLHEGGKDACQGDSGGPLMCRNPNNPNQWYLAGIVSHGEGCARPNEPGVYTRVSKYMGWIAEHSRDGQLTLRTPLQKCPGFICKGTKRCVSKKRHCDKIVDCLLGDDEINCDNTFHNLFKVSRNSLIDQKRAEFENKFLNNMAEDLAPELSVIGSKNLLKELNQTLANLTKGFDVNHNISKTDMIKEEDYFKCTKLLQVIPGHKRCNKFIDCEDGTDEINCSCKDYVNNEDENAICDGITDCLDLSDENICLNCTESEFACRLSQECIPLGKRCNGIKDCKSHEDEINCAILSNDKFLTFDKDNQPTLLSKGIVTLNRNGTWKPLCLKNTSTSDTNKASTATKICNELGFGEYSSYHNYLMEEKDILEMKNNNMKQFAELNMTIREPCSDCCEGLYVSCSENSFTPSSLKHTKLTNSKELYNLPWMAAIFVDGTYKCIGTLIDPRWIVTSANCFTSSERLDGHQVTAALGKGKLKISVKGPHEQIIKIIQNIPVVSGNMIILQTAKNITFDRYVQPAKLEVRRESLQKEKCYTVGLDDTNSILFVNVLPIKNCLVGYRCFEANQQEHCKFNQPWSGTIVCDSRNGWYPAAVYSSIKGPCGFSPDMRFTSIKYHKNRISSLISLTHHKDATQPVCNGFLCELGKCIPKTKICDGISDCQGNEDENPDFCYEKEKQCHLQDDCSCPQSHLKCPSSNKCFSKSSYCDRIKNCGEFEDEPEICSCRSYLKLTSPHKICDGVLHCMDRSDEDPSICTCKIEDFHCGIGNGNNSTQCVPQDLVCDGVEDCPNGEDEKTCLSINLENQEKTNAGEVLSRTAGVWHTGCFSLNYTTIQLEDMCMKLGFTGGSASQLPLPKNVTSMETLKPVLDQFEAVWLRRIPGNRMKLRMRTGSDPYVKFVPNEGCHRLFIACI